MAELQAHIRKVEQEIGSEWFSIETDDSAIKKLSTKIKKVAEDAAALRISGDLAKIGYTQRDRESNGRIYHNYYLDSCEAASTNGASGIDQVTPTGRKTDPEDAWRMSLAKGAELAIRTLPLMPTEQRDFDTQKRLAVAWGRFITETPKPGAAPVEDVSVELPIPPTDDIPF